MRVVWVALSAVLGVLVVTTPSTAHAPAADAPQPTRTVTSGARGVSAWAAPGVEAGLRRSGADWVYNWDAGPSFGLPRGVQFVPMIWDAAAATPDRLARAASYGPELLGFNEPDRADQADLTVEEALDAWPALESTGLRLGSPAVATGAPDPDGWLGRFMSGAAERGLRVDFVAVHWYGSGDFRTGPAVRELRDYLRAVYEAYRVPVWLTEYALLGFDGDVPRYPTPAQQARFATRSAQMLRGLPWLERYAWFALLAPASGPSTGLYRPDGSATPVGRAFRNAPR